MIAGAGEEDAAFDLFDTVDLEEELDGCFALAPVEEEDDDFSFFVDRDAEVTFMVVRPRLADEVEFAREHGTETLLEKFEGRPKYFGWGRTSKESVLR